METDGNPQEEGSLTKRVLATDRWFREFSSKPFLFSLSVQCATRSRFKNTTALPAWKLCNCIYTRPCAGTQFPFKAVWMSYAKARMTEILSNSTGQALKNLERHWWSELGEQNCSISLALCGAQCVTDMWSILIHYVIHGAMIYWYLHIFTACTGVLLILSKFHGQFEVPGRRQRSKAQSAGTECQRQDLREAQGRKTQTVKGWIYWSIYICINWYLMIYRV